MKTRNNNTCPTISKAFMEVVEERTAGPVPAEDLLSYAKLCGRFAARLMDEALYPESFFYQSARAILKLSATTVRQLRAGEAVLLRHLHEEVSHELISWRATRSDDSLLFSPAFRAIFENFGRLLAAYLCDATRAIELPSCEFEHAALSY